MNRARPKSWWLAPIALCLSPACGAPQPPSIGPNLVRNGSFESGLDGWWTAMDSEGGEASTRPEAADRGTAGLVLTKGSGGWGSIVGQETGPHQAGDTFLITARLKGTEGGERVAFNFHGQGFEVVADTHWRTVRRMVLLLEASSNTSAFIGLTTDGATVHVDEVAFALAEVERGDADRDEDNLLHNGSFESDLGLWSVWADSLPEGSATTSPEARRSGYAGLVLSKGFAGSGTSVKQALPDPLGPRESYRFKVSLRGALGGEQVSFCLQMNRTPWAGPCVQITAETDWLDLSEELSANPSLVDERVGALISLLSEGSVFVDDVSVSRR